MAIPLSDATVHAMLDAQFNGATVYISLHTANPSTNGANEVTGGTYGRQQVAFDAAANRATVNTDAETWTLMPSCTITHFGAWTAATNGTFKGGGKLTADQVINAGGTVTLAAGALSFGISGTDPEA